MKLLKKITIILGLVTAISFVGSKDVKAGVIETQAQALTNQWIVTNVYAGNAQLALSDPNYLALYNNTYPVFVQMLNQQQAAATQAINGATVSVPVATGNGTYIYNRNTGKFHYTSCASVTKMKNKNKEVINGSRNDVLAKHPGASPCKNCNP